MEGEELKAVVKSVLGELLAPIIEKIAGIEQSVEAQKAETERALETLVSEGLSPIAEHIGLIQQQTHQEKNKKDKDEEDKKKNDPSTGVQNWINDKATGGLGGKDLFGPTPFNPNPKTVNPGPTHLDGKLTGKTV